MRHNGEGRRNEEVSKGDVDDFRVGYDSFGKILHSRSTFETEMEMETRTTFGSVDSKGDIERVFLR